MFDLRSLKHSKIIYEVSRPIFYNNVTGAMCMPDAPVAG